MGISVSERDEPNRALWLATRANKVELSCPLRITRFVPQEKFLWSRLIKILFRNFFPEKSFLRQLKISRGLCIDKAGKREKRMCQREWKQKSKNVDEFHEFTLQQKPGNTKVKTQSDIKAWKRFCVQENENRELCEIPEEEFS